MNYCYYVNWTKIFTASLSTSPEKGRLRADKIHLFICLESFFRIFSFSSTFWENKQKSEIPKERFFNFLNPLLFECGQTYRTNHLYCNIFLIKLKYMNCTLGESASSGKRLAFCKLFLIFHNARSLSIAQSSNHFVNVMNRNWSILISLLFKLSALKGFFGSVDKSMAINWNL